MHALTSKILLLYYSVLTLSLSLSSKFSWHLLAVLCFIMASAVSLALERSLEIAWVKFSFWSLLATNLAWSWPTLERGMSDWPVSTGDWDFASDSSPLPCIVYRHEANCYTCILQTFSLLKNCLSQRRKTFYKPNKILIKLF